MSSPPLSVAIITKDEEANLPRCLDSLRFAGDIVVVDCGSRDRTVEIARSYGCRVFVEGWKGYGLQKQGAIERCGYRWVLSVDADEVVPPETAECILKVIGSPAGAAFSFRRKNLLRGRWIRHCGWWPDRVVRLFDREKGRIESPVHEKWITEGRVIPLPEAILHYSFRDYSHMVQKFDLYSTLSAVKLFDQGARVNLLSPILHGGFTFFKTFFLKLGLLEGLDGLVISTLSAMSSFLKYSKLLEMKRRGALEDIP